VELFTLFDFAEALGKEWQVNLRDHVADIEMIFQDAQSLSKSTKISVLMSGDPQNALSNIYTATTTSAIQPVTKVLHLSRTNQGG
jgi:hypothetical protein